MTTQQAPRNAEGVDFSGSPMAQLLRGGVFPDWWTFVPVHGKATYLEEWTKRPLTREKLLEAYRGNSRYRGLGVVTGEFSGGLIAIDIDGDDADRRYRDFVGDAYEPLGQESTMSWTSGKPGRRQVFYRVPQEFVPQLREVKTVILGFNGEWYLGKGDMARAGGFEPPPGAIGEGAAPALDQEVVLRFNGCQSVVPGSPHPSTSKLYQWLNYNGGQVEMAPQWVLDVLRQFRKPLRWLSEEDQLALDQELGETLIPEKQIRGWFFKEEIQQMLLPRLEDLVFKHQTFEHYGWQSRNGSNPQRMSGCPWHGGASGTAFQYSTVSGCWDCKACGVGGDVLDFMHKVRVDDRYAPRPRGAVLETYVAEIASGLGLDYPACAEIKEVITKEGIPNPLDPRQFFECCRRILEEEANSEVAHNRVMLVARSAGYGHIYRRGVEIEAAVERFLFQEEANAELPDNWQDQCRNNRSYLIPDFISRPTSIMLHARGGLGKTRLAILLSKIIGRQLPMTVRGIKVKPTASGDVLFIGSDMSETDYAEYLDQQGINVATTDRYFKFKSSWQVTEYRKMRKWLTDYKPALVVIDSLTSVSSLSGIKEYEKEYANIIYRLTRENGKEFPPTTFLWIHHNTKGGETFRGTDALRNAVHETWELKELSDADRLEFGDRALILEIQKCRGLRGGHRFVVKEDLSEALSISDLTPTVTRFNHGLGDETPRTIVLGLLKDAEGPLTVKELHAALGGRLAGQGCQEKVVDRTVRRWVEAWVKTGLVEEVLRPTGQRGRPLMTYQISGSSLYEENLSKNPPSFFQTSSGTTVPEDGIFDTAMSKNPDVTKSDHNSSVVSGETPETQSSPEDGVTEMAVEAPSGEPAEEAGIFGHTPSMSKNPEAETQLQQGVSEEGPGFFDTPAGIRRDGDDPLADPEWDAVRWG